MKVYLVGGAVRDQLLGLPVKERDWVVVGSTPEEMLAQGGSIIVNGTVYDQNNPTGTEILVGQSQNGCDSIIFISLTFEESEIVVSFQANSTTCEFGNDGSIIIESMPSMDQFDHMIVYVPSLEEQPFIDGVDANFEFGSGPPTGLGGRLGLVIAEDGGSIVKLPQYRYSLENPVAQVSSEICVSSEAAEVVIAHEVLELNGYYGMWMRNTLLNLDRERYESEIQDYINRYLPKGGEFRSVVVGELKNPARPLRLEVKYSFPLSESGFLEYCPLWEQYYLDMESSSTRIHPYQLNYPFSIRSKVRCEEELTLDFSNREDHRKLRKDGVLNYRWEI